MKPQAIKPVATPKTGIVANPKNVSTIIKPGVKISPESELKLWINGIEKPVKNHRDRFIQVLDYLSQKDSSLLTRLNALAPTGMRPTVATTPEALYPKNPGFAKARKTAWRELPSAKGWFVNVNNSGEGMLDYIKLACKTAGVELGKEIVVK